MKEKEMLVSEMDTLRQRLKNMSLYTEELEKRTGDADQKIQGMQEELEAHMSEISKERRTRQRAQDEAQQLHEELDAKLDDLTVKDPSPDIFPL